MQSKAFIYPSWPVAANIKSVITTAIHPVQASGDTSPFADFNLAQHVGDNAEQVAANRQVLQTYAKLPEEPIWLTQVHSTDVQIAGQTLLNSADAIYAHQVNKVCAIMTADCLPILLANKAGSEIAALHAGWRGLQNGVIENTVKQFRAKSLIAYLGPAISQDAYQVGEEVYQAFCQHDSKAKLAFAIDKATANKYKMNIYLLAKQRLQALGIKDVYGGDFCTFKEQRFYSYRQACQKTNGITGRMVSLIWINDKI